MTTMPRAVASRCLARRLLAFLAVLVSGLDPGVRRTLRGATALQSVAGHRRRRGLSCRPPEHSQHEHGLRSVPVPLRLSRRVRRMAQSCHGVAWPHGRAVRRSAGPTGRVGTWAWVDMPASSARRLEVRRECPTCAAGRRGGRTGGGGEARGYAPRVSNRQKWNLARGCKPRTRPRHSNCDF